MSLTTWRLPVLSQGCITSHVEVLRTAPIAVLSAQLRCLGYRFTSTRRGRLALERLH